MNVLPLNQRAIKPVELNNVFSTMPSPLTSHGNPPEMKEAYCKQIAPIIFLPKEKVEQFELPRIILSFLFSLSLSLSLSLSHNYDQILMHLITVMF